MSESWLVKGACRKARSLSPTWNCTSLRPAPQAIVRRSLSRLHTRVETRFGS